MPFIRTAVLGSEGAPVLPEDEYVNHFGIIRLRVQGSGVLRPMMYTMDDVFSDVLTTITMTATSQYIRECRSNFKSQRMSLELRTTAIDEVVRINKIIIFVRPLWASLAASVA